MLGIFNFLGNAEEAKDDDNLINESPEADEFEYLAELSPEALLEVERERKEKEDREKEEREKKEKEEHEKAAQEAGSFNIFGPVFSLLTPEEPEAKKKRSSFTELANADEAKLPKKTLAERL